MQGALQDSIGAVLRGCRGGKCLCFQTNTVYVRASGSFGGGRQAAAVLCLVEAEHCLSGCGVVVFSATEWRPNRAPGRWSV
jgi:hypothetical protein